MNSPITDLPFVGVAYSKRLEKLGIKTIGDLFLHVPSKYLDFRTISPISGAKPGEILTVRGIVIDAKNVFTRYGKNFQIVKIKDATGEMSIVWFNQPYLVKNFAIDQEYAFAGKVDTFNHKPTMISPEYERAGDKSVKLHTSRLIPIYPETSGVSSKWLRTRIDTAFEKSRDHIDEFLPDSILKEYSLPDFPSAIEMVHYPKTPTDFEKGRERLGLNELISLQLKSIYRKIDWQNSKVRYKLKVDNKEVDKFISTLPFALTASQKKAYREILNDLAKDYPMNRLLEGDVGSGKTVVAAIAAIVSFLNGYQTVVMAPTQILAEQHYQTFQSILTPIKMRVALVTSQGVKADPGKTDIFIGTHALIHKRVPFDKVALVVIDEQHRFGVEQRTHLTTLTGDKKRNPHVLTMTATPIPRTIALTVYGDLDLSVLTELPLGRQEITTWVVPPQKRLAAYNWIGKGIRENHTQAFVVCPLIEESDKETMQTVKAASEVFKNLKKVYPDLSLTLLHGKLPIKDKNAALENFRSRKSDILVTTPVVEVGIDIPNATIMAVETAERFGLAQLHQLRGRVGRGEAKSYCLLFADTKSEKALTRLQAMQETSSGFKLAEMDLKLRGPGEVFGTMQHGFFELKIASWGDFELIKKSKEIAEKLTDTKKFSSSIVKVLNLDKISLN